MTNYNCLSDNYIRKFFSKGYYNFKDKDRCLWNEIDYMTLRCLKIFGYDNLPDSIDKRNLELWLQSSGVVCITDKPDGKLRVYFGSLGGELDANYRPKTFIVTNPWNNFNKELSVVWDEDTIDNDCVVIRNDSLYKGLLPLHFKFATETVENDISLLVVDILSRMPTIFKSDDERSAKSADMFLEEILEGDFHIVRDTAFLEGLQDVQLNNQMHMIFHQLVEYRQYIKSEWQENIGINAMYNLKREAISDSEKSMSEDSLLPLIDNMREERIRGFDLVNKKWNQNIIVHFDSSWEDNQIEIELEQKIMEAEANESEGISEDGNRSDSTETKRSEGDEDSNSGVVDGVGGGGHQVDEQTDSTSENSEINVNVEINVNKDSSEEAVENEEKDENS